VTKSALIIANWQYEDALLRGLVAPSQDAEALAEVLRDQTIGGFEVQVLTNAPSYRVYEDTEAFFGDRDRDDLLLYYFSGHGVTDDDGQLYYAASNTLHKRLRSTAVAASWVNDIMNGCRSRRQILLLDCCHSGAVGRTKAAASVNVGKYFTGTTPEEGRGKFILTASDAFQYSFEGDEVEGKGVNSVFTDAVVEGLRTGEADLDGDGQITLDELYSFVYRRVRERTSQQTPRKWASDVEGAVVIAANPRPTEAPLPEDLQAAIDSFVVEARERAIPRLDKLLRGKHRGLALTAHNVLSALANDDSRRVSIAAERCLAVYSEELAAEQTEAERVAKEKAQAAEKAAREQAERERLAAERAAAERVVQEKADAALRAEQEREERERLAKAKEEANRLAKEANQRAVREQAERERIAAEKAQAERVAAERAEAERIAKEKAQAAERVAQKQAKRIAREKANAIERDRIASEKAKPAPLNLAEAIQTTPADQEPDPITRALEDSEKKTGVRPTPLATILGIAGLALTLVASYPVVARWFATDHSNESRVSSVLREPGASGNAKEFQTTAPGFSTKPATYKFSRALMGNNNEVFAVAFDPKSQLLAAGGYGKTFNVYSLASGEIVHKLEHQDVWCLAFNHDGTLLASGGLHSAVQLWNPATGDIVGKLGSPWTDSVYAVAFAVSGEYFSRAEGELLAWGDTTQPRQGQTELQYAVHVVRTSDRKEIATLPGRETMGMSFFPKGDYLAGVGETGIVSWNVPSHPSEVGWSEVYVAPVKGRAQALAIDPAASGKLMAAAAGGQDGTVVILDRYTGQLQRSFIGVNGMVRSLAFSPDSRLLAVAGWGEVRLWNTSDWTLAQVLTHDAPPGSKGSGINSVVFSSDGHWLATGGQEKLHVRLWEGERE
jgi:WD40 repeat protein